MGFFLTILLFILAEDTFRVVKKIPKQIIASALVSVIGIVLYCVGVSGFAFACIPISALFLYVSRGKEVMYGKENST